MLCLLVSFAFSFGAACCFRFIPVFWVHVFASCCMYSVRVFSLGTSGGFHVGFCFCMYLVGVFFPLGLRAVFTSVFVFACIWLVYFFPWDLGRLPFHLAGSCVSFIRSCDISTFKIFSSFIRVNVPFYGRASV